MRIERSWSASSKSEEFEKSDNLVNLSGLWNVGIEVSITMPHTHSKGPIEKSISRKEIYEEEIPPSANTV